MTSKDRERFLLGKEEEEEEEEEEKAVLVYTRDLSF